MLDFTTLPYVDDRFKAVRRETVQVRVGDAVIGGNARRVLEITLLRTVGLTACSMRSW